MCYALRLKFAVLLSGFACFSTIAAADPVTYTGVKVRIVENGSVLQKTLKELGSKEAQAALITTCAVFGADCTKFALALGEIKNSIKKDGEEHRGHFYSPEGLVLCRVQLKVHSHDGGTTFNATYRSNADGGGDRIDFYAVVPQRTKKRAIDMSLFMTYVKAIDRDKYDCLPPPETALWRCPHNWKCSNKAPDYVAIRQPK